MSARRVGSWLALAVALASPIALADSAPRLIEAPEVSLPDDGSVPPDASVRLEFTVDVDGHVQDVTVVESLRPDLDAQVLDAARRMVFHPAERGGVNVPARMRFRFRLRPTAARERSLIPPNPYTDDDRSTAGVAPTATDHTETTVGPAAPVAPTPEPTEDVAGEATIRARRQPGAATVMTLRGEELTTVPGTLGEPTRVVATMPGVARTPFGLGFFVVRGASFENTGFFIDGFPVPLLYHFGAGPAVISSRLVGQLDFYPGGYPLQYGRFSAGVISLDTRPPPTDRPFLEFSVDVLKASAMAVVPFDHGRGSIAIAARRSYYELIAPLIVDGVNLSYTDYQVRADYRFSSRSRVSLFWFGSQDALDRTAATGSGQTVAEQQSSISYVFHRLIAKYEHGLPNQMQLSLSTMLGVDDTRFTNIEPGQQTQSFQSTGFILGERATLRVPTGRHATTSFGLDVLTISFDADLRVPLDDNIGAVPPPASDPMVLAFRPRLTELSVSPWIEEQLRYGPVELTAGLRLDRLEYAAVKTWTYDPRAVLRVRAGDRVTVVGATGFFHQAPPFFQLVPQVRNPDIVPQRSLQSSVGVELNLPWNLEARVTGYLNEMYNLQRSTSGVATQGGTLQRSNVVDDGQGRAFGLEVMLRRRLDHGVYGWVSYTLSRSERRQEINGAVVWTPFAFDQTHVLNLALSWDINTRWRVGARFQLATGSPRRRVTGSYFDADTDSFRPVLLPRQVDDSDTERLPTYHQLDVRVDYRFRWGPLRMSAYLDVINAYFAQNTENWVYQYDYARRVPFPGLPILPALGLSGEL